MVADWIEIAITLHSGRNESLKRKKVKKRDSFTLFIHSAVEGGGVVSVF